MLLPDRTITGRSADRPRSRKCGGDSIDDRTARRVGQRAPAVAGAFGEKRAIGRGSTAARNMRLRLWSCGPSDVRERSRKPPDTASHAISTARKRSAVGVARARAQVASMPDL